jgi:ergothioneine biosynthesis protein EgtB
MAQFFLNGKEMDRNKLADYYRNTRMQTEQICRPLETEDYIPQPVLEVSPPRWHLAHSTWFFETFVLQRYEQAYRPHDPLYSYIFNSYYHSLGERWERNKRGNLSRPTVKDIYRYRHSTDERILALIDTLPEHEAAEVEEILTLGIHHEQQHQELLVTDIKYILAGNPMKPVYGSARSVEGGVEPARDFEYMEGGFFEMGFGGNSFAFDNEKPPHKAFVRPFRLRRSLVTNGEYLEFMEAGGYRDFRHWLDEGWDQVRLQGWESPLYWHREDEGWYEMTLNGYRRLLLEAPVTHISYYEADAFARWAGKRLATEVEWEYAAKSREQDLSGANFLDKQRFHPEPCTRSISSGISQLFGDVWEWTSSAYLPYDGFKTAEGAIGEYNGKFMINQMVLRGGSCATPQNHIRSTYRNFFHPDKRWQFSGIRLAESV